MKSAFATLLLLAAAMLAAPASAQSAAACPAAPDFSRYGAEREAVEYARAMGLAVNAREEAAGLVPEELEAALEAGRRAMAERPVAISSPYPEDATFRTAFFPR